MTTCLSDKLTTETTLKAVTVEGSTNVRIVTASGRYLNDGGYGIVTALVIPAYDLGNFPGTVFSPEVVTSSLLGDAAGALPGNVVGLEYVGFKTASGGYVSIDLRTSKVVVSAQLDLKASFLTNVLQRCT